MGEEYIIHSLKTALNTSDLIAQSVGSHVLRYRLNIKKWFGLNPYVICTKLVNLTQYELLSVLVFVVKDPH